MLIDRISLFVATSPLQGPYTCTCDCPLNDKTRQGVQCSEVDKQQTSGVARNYKGWKSSESAPEEGNKYKVTKYWPEKNKNGFIVWKYLFRRDKVGIFRGKIVTRFCGFNFREITALQYACMRFNLWVKKYSQYMLNSERLYTLSISMRCP